MDLSNYSAKFVSMVTSKAELLNIIKLNQSNIKKFGVARLALFGSFVRDQAKKESDVDFFVEFQPGKKTYKNFIGLVFFLESKLERRVEVLTDKSLSPYLRTSILNSLEYVSV
jgi:predicted nucleotidyltransferase